MQRVVRLLGSVVDPIVVVAAAGQELPELPETVIVARDEKEYLGPLNGLVAGLTGLAGRAHAAYASSCDVPFLSPAFVRRVCNGLGDADVCVPEIGGYMHPLAAAYRVTVFPIAVELVAAGRLRPVYLTERVRTRVLSDADFTGLCDWPESLRNVNSPADYQAALHDAGYGPEDPG